MIRLLLALILTIFSVVFSASALAGWTYVSKTPSFSVYADNLMIRRLKNKAIMWTLFDFKSTQKLSTGEHYLSYRQQLQFDCRAKKMKILSYIVSEQNMALGKTVLMDDAPFDNDDEMPSEWEPDAPKSMQGVLHKVACSNNKK